MCFVREIELERTRVPPGDGPRGLSAGEVIPADIEPPVADKAGEGAGGGGGGGGGRVAEGDFSRGLSVAVGVPPELLAVLLLILFSRLADFRRLLSPLRDGDLLRGLSPLADIDGGVTVTGVNPDGKSSPLLLSNRTGLLRLLDLLVCFVLLIEDIFYYILLIFDKLQLN